VKKKIKVLLLSMVLMFTMLPINANAYVDEIVGVFHCDIQSLDACCTSLIEPMSGCPALVHRPFIMFTLSREQRFGNINDFCFGRYERVTSLWGCAVSECSATWVAHEIVGRHNFQVAGLGAVCLSCGHRIRA